MAISKIRIVNWATYNDVTVELNNEDSLISGINGSGKTVFFTTIGYFIGGDSYFRRIKDSTKEDNKRTIENMVFGRKGDSISLRNYGEFYSYIQVEMIDTKNCFKTFTLLFEPLTSQKVRVFRYCFDGRLEEFPIISEDGSYKDHNLLTKEHQGDNKTTCYQNQKDMKMELEKVLGVRDIDLLVQQLAFNSSENRQTFSDSQRFFDMIIPKPENHEIESFFDGFELLKKEENKLNDIISEKNYLNNLLVLFQKYEKNINEIKDLEFIKKGISKNIDCISLSNYENEKSKLDSKEIQLEEEITILEKRHSNIITEISDIDTKMLEKNAGLFSLEDKLINEKRFKNSLINSKMIRDGWFNFFNDCSKKEKDLKIDDFLKEISRLYHSQKKIEPLITKYMAYIQNQKDKYFENRIRLEDRRNELLKRINEVKQELESLKQDRWKPKWIQSSQREFKEQFEKKVKKLYSLEEFNLKYLYETFIIREKSWRKTIEAFLGNKRFNLVIPKEYRDIALELYDSYSREKRSDIFLIFYSESEKVSANENSLNQYIDIVDNDANQFLTATLNGTFCVTKKEFREVYTSLKNGWITSDGDAYIGFSLRNYSTPYEVIGVEAIQKRIRELEEEWIILKRDFECLNVETSANEGMINSIDSIIDYLYKWSDDWLLLDEKENEIIKEIQNLKKSIEEIKDSNYVQLSIRKSELKDDFKKIKSIMEEKRGKSRKNAEEIYKLESKINGLKTEIKCNDFDPLLHNSSFFQNEWKKIDTSSLIALNDKLNSISSAICQRSEDHKDETSLVSALLNYNSIFNHNYSIEDKHVIIEIFGNINKRIEEITSKIINQKLILEHLFFTNFIKNIVDNFEIGIKTINQYNRSLQNWDIRGEHLILDLIDRNFYFDSLEGKILYLIEKYKEYGDISNLFLNEYEGEIRYIVEKLIELRNSNSIDDVINEYTDFKHYKILEIRVRRVNGLYERLSETKSYSSNGEFKRAIFLLQLLALSSNTDERFSNAKSIALVDEFSNDFDEDTVDIIMELCQKQKNVQFILSQQSCSRNPLVPKNQFVVAKQYINSIPYSFIAKREVRYE